MRNNDYEDVPRTLVLATGLWTLVVAAGTRAEVFARLPGEVVMAIAIFATAFAVSAVTVDARVRGWFEHRSSLAARLALSALAGTMLVTGAALATAHQAPVGAFPWAPVVLLGMPLTAALAVAALRAAMRARTGAARTPAAMAPLLGRR